MNNSLGRQFTFGGLLKFALPNMIMMVFMSLYTIVDGIFISRVVGTTALSAINMSYPINCVEMAVGIMLATGSSAVIARRMGEGKSQLAKENFTQIVVIAAGLGVTFLVLITLFMRPILLMLGTSAQQYPYCETYTGILMWFAPAMFLQIAFQTLFITAGKPHFGLITTVLAGLTNMGLDYVFIVVLHKGIAGAAIATGIGSCIPAAFGVLYFAFCRKGNLYFVPFHFDGRMLLNSCTNGSSEMVTNIATAITTFLFNYMFMRFYQEDGVASISIVLYFQFVYAAIYFGFSMGIAPVISYKYGRGDHAQLRLIVSKSLGFVLLCSLAAFALSLLTITPALGIFTQEGTNVYEITRKGFPIFALSFLFMGVSTWASSLFTALSNGVVSAVISFARTFLFLVGAILILPELMGAAGVWWAVPIAELLGLVVAVGFVAANRKKYHY